MAVPRFVVGVDGSDGAKAAVRWCARYAPSLDAEVTAVAVTEARVPLVPPPAGYADALEEAVDKERDEAGTAFEADWCRPLRDAGARYETRSVFGDPAASLMETAAEVGADLLVVGRRGRGRFVEALVGSVPRTLAHAAQVPLLIVPSSYHAAA
jgi:nucleotide-binding universal stress UspA family protein